MTTDHALERLFSPRAWHKSTGIRENTARIYKKRFRENKLELETKIKILRWAGYQLVCDMDWKQITDPAVLKAKLIKKLMDNKVFWSYELPDINELPDEVLIEKVLHHLDIEEVTDLFSLYPASKIKKVWMDRMLVQEPLYHAVNRLYAFLFFRIKNPDVYIQRFLKKQQVIYARPDKTD